MDDKVFFKDGSDKTVEIDLLLNDTETLVSVTVGAVTPAVNPPLTIECTVEAEISEFVLASGSPNTSYGAPITVVTTERTFVFTLVCTVGTDVFIPYNATDSGGYTDLIGSIDSGNAAIGTCLFQFSSGDAPLQSRTTWELLDKDGVVYAMGNAFKQELTDDGLSAIIIARCVVSVPFAIPPSDVPYQLRYTLHVEGNVDPSVQNRYYSYENVTVTGLATIPTGCQSTLELIGDVASVQLVTEELYDQVQVELYVDNNLLATSPLLEGVRVANGYFYAASFPTSQMKASVESYKVMWKYGMSGYSQTNRESAHLYLINPSISSAITDVLAKVSKARTTLYGTTDYDYTPLDIMTWLRRGRDRFNAAYGIFTSFTMLNAKGPVREFWLMCAELAAMESQYIAEGEKAFNFQGANISLDVDRTGMLDSAIGRIQSQLDNELKPLKENLVRKGQTGGDGSADPSKLAPGAIGAVGITITPATVYGIVRPVGRFPRGGGGVW